MKTVLTDIQDALKAGLDGTVRNQDIYIAPHVDYIPSYAKQPCIGIKDGAIQRVRDTIGGCVEENLTVLIICWVEVPKKGGVSVVGDDQNIGILDLADSVRTLLDNNTLDNEFLDGAWCKSESASDILSSDKAMLSRKILNFVYEKRRYI